MLKCTAVDEKDTSGEEIVLEFLEKCKVVENVEVLYSASSVVELLRRCVEVMGRRWPSVVVSTAPTFPPLTTIPSFATCMDVEIKRHMAEKFVGY